jgi:hypothetical protein
VPEDLHPTIRWSVQHPNPLESDVQDIPWQIVNRKENINSNSDNTMFKASNSFIAAKGSMPLLYKIMKPTSSKCKADNQDAMHIIKKLKILHISSGDAIKKKQKLIKFDEDDIPPGTQWDENNYSCAYDALFTILFNIWETNPKKWRKKYSKTPINIFLHCMMDSKNI